MASTEDGFAPFDELLKAAEASPSPWQLDGSYLPDIDLLRQLLSIPIGQGDKQESGRTAKALDAWTAYELRRAGFPAEGVWPRTRRPRVLGEGLGDLERRIDGLGAQLTALESASQPPNKLRPPELRRAIREVQDARLGSGDASILGDFYAKQVDVGLSSWRRGPDILISTKTMFSAYRKNLRNRHEEAVGEISSLRRRHPMAAMGYVYLVHESVYTEEGAYAILNDILTRLRRPGETFDATLLLLAAWNEKLSNPEVISIEQPDPELTAGRFFQDIIASVTSRSPIMEHRAVRLRRDGQPVGGSPESEDVGDHLQ